MPLGHREDDDDTPSIRILMHKFSSKLTASYFSCQATQEYAIEAISELLTVPVIQVQLCKVAYNDHGHFAFKKRLSDMCN